MKTSVTIDGERFELATLDELTFGEQRELKRLSGGLSIAAIEAGLQEMDPDAWFGLILFSIRRVRPAFEESALEAVNFASVVESWTRSLQEAAAAEQAERDAAEVPPPVAAAGALPAAAHLPTSSGSAAIPAPSGVPSFSASTAYGPSI